MTSDMEVTELHIDAFVGGKCFFQSGQIFFFTAKAIAHFLVTGRYLITCCLIVHHVTNDNEGIVAEHLAQEIYILGGVRSPEVLAIVEYYPASFLIFHIQFVRKYLGCFLKEGMIVGHLFQIRLTQTDGFSACISCTLPTGIRCLPCGVNRGLSFVQVFGQRVICFFLLIYDPTLMVYVAFPILQRVYEL